MTSKKQNKPNFKTNYLCNLRNLWFQFMQNKANFSEAGSRPLEAFLPNEPNYASSSHSVASVAKKLFLQNKPNLKITCLCNLCNLWFQFLPNEPKSKAAQTSGLEG